MPDKLLKRRGVEELIGLSRSSIYKLIRKGSFPPPVKISAMAVRWKESDIHAWIQSRPVARAEVGNKNPVWELPT